LEILIWSVMDRHFADEDYALLGDNIQLIQKIVTEAQTASIPIRLEETLERHPGFISYVQAVDGRSVYVSKGFDIGAAFDAIAKLSPERNDLAPVPRIP